MYVFIAPGCTHFEIIRPMKNIFEHPKYDDFPGHKKYMVSVDDVLKVRYRIIGSNSDLEKVKKRVNKLNMLMDWIYGMNILEK